jgi:eukaryotic-like serine/threonine-protein kinase
LPGFSFVRVLGSGGFADVFLYEQNMPRRPVAVKVLLAEVVNDQLRQLFQAEANLMAQLSSHPSILTVFQASVSADGRPYLVMEYCSAALGQRYRNERIPVSEVLSIGVKIASAVETAHREGVLHRDIKPSNILTTAYGHPVLSDFGIASTLGEAEATEAVGLSIPWSAPEVLLDDVSGSVAAEVWSLGATIYSLLAGRSPFEVPDGANGSADLIARIGKAKLPPTGRPDVPASLEAVLRRAMSRRPEDRQRSALEVIRELQAVEAELGLPQTPIEIVLDDWVTSSTVDPDDRTRITGAHSIEQAQPSRRRRASSTARAGATRSSASRSADGASGTVAATGGRRSRILIATMIAAAVLVLAVAATAVLALIRGGTGTIPTVSDIAARIDGPTVVFSWDDPGLIEGDAYLVSVDGTSAGVQRGSVFQVDGAGAGRVCLTVRVSRAGQAGPESAEKCAEVDGG